MNLSRDERIVMTLDGGGTNFVFSAIQGGNEVVQPIVLPANGHDLDLCLATIVNGFERIRAALKEKSSAISFAFPGPADYPRGIIGDLGNLPAFRGGVALGPMLETKFNLPVFINNDGDLFAYGEAIAGYLPSINALLEQAGSSKRFNNLAGFTLGTGFGAGIVSHGQLFRGDNSNAAEVWLLTSKRNPGMNVEEGVSIRAIQRTYAEVAGIAVDNAPSPREIYKIGTGDMQGNKQAAVAAFDVMAAELGNAIANVLTLMDGIAVIGGGIANAHPLFLKKVVAEMNSSFCNAKNETYRRLAQQAFNLEDARELALFLQGNEKYVTIPGSDKKIIYDSLARVGVGISKMGTSKAVAVGAYAFALNELSKGSERS